MIVVGKVTGNKTTGNICELCCNVFVEGDGIFVEITPGGVAHYRHTVLDCQASVFEDNGDAALDETSPPPVDISKARHLSIVRHPSTTRVFDQDNA